LELAKAINIRGLSETSLNIHRQFYRVYPQIRQVVSDELKGLGFDINPIVQLTTEQLHNFENQSLTIVQTPSAQLQKSTTNDLQVPPDKLISRLSFTHLSILIPISEPLKRTFYEIE
ncbi:MAG: hypothetical protein ACKPFK_32635, partial [Dolichospermum sp.]